MGRTISDITPAHGTIQDSEVLRVAFTARDETLRAAPRR